MEASINLIFAAELPQVGHGNVKIAACRDSRRSPHAVLRVLCQMRRTAEVAQKTRRLRADILAASDLESELHEEPVKRGVGAGAARLTRAVPLPQQGAGSLGERRYARDCAWYCAAGRRMRWRCRPRRATRDRQRSRSQRCTKADGNCDSRRGRPSGADDRTDALTHARAHADAFDPCAGGGTGRDAKPLRGTGESLGIQLLQPPHHNSHATVELLQLLQLHRELRQWSRLRDRVPRWDVQ